MSGVYWRFEAEQELWDHHNRIERDNPGFHVWLIGSTPPNLHNLVWCAIRDYCAIAKIQVEWYAVVHAENHLHILVMSIYASWRELFFGQAEVMLFEQGVNAFIGRAILASTGTDKPPPWMWT